VSELLTVDIQGKFAMKKSEAKANRLEGRRRWPKRIEGTPMQVREGATNRLIARRIRELRILSGLSLSLMGAAIGVSYQEFQKYEKGVNTVGAARLKAIAETLGVPIGYFFDREEATAQDGELPIDILRVAGKLLRMEERTPGGFRKLRGVINALAKEKG
jgi:transcriptional regulator with XRE-family HTH domain